MFSSFASFLPSSLHLGPTDPQSSVQFQQDDPASEDERDDLVSASKQSSDHSQPPVKLREKTANESFIIVRPPPSKSNHPLNLQVQLVPPNIKPPSGVVSRSTASIHSVASDADQTLSRASSIRSDASSVAPSGSSTTSFSSVGSSSPSTRRTIVPLYNLQAHNVMTNVIVDAGTDAKIAKFQRRGIVLIDLASLEPVEVWGDHPSCAARTNGEDSQPMQSRIPTTLSIPASSGGHTPEHHLTALPSVTSLNPVKTSQSENLQQSYPEPQPHLPFPPNLSDDPDATPVSTPKLPATSPAKRNFFGKLFQGNANKKSKNSPSRSPAPSPSPMTDRLPLPSKPTSKVSHLSSPSNSLLPKSAENIRPAEKGHTKNISLTTFTVPMKATLKSKNRLSAAATSSSSSLNGSMDAQGAGLGMSQRRNSNLIAPSSNVSASSLAATTESMESESIAHGNQSLPIAPHHHQLSHSTSHSLTTPTNPPPPQTQLQKLQSRPPVLGIQPTFVSALGSNLSGTCGKKMRALMYVWIIRRWLKQPAHDDNSSSHGPTGRGGFLGLGSGSKGDEQNGNAAEPGSGIEVRFEWKRGKVKSSNRGRTRNTRGEVGDRRSSMTTNDSSGVAEKNGEARRKRSVNRTSSLSGSGKSSRSIGSGVGSEDGSDELRRRGLRRPTSSHHSSEGMGESGDDGDESDPEDSETPWVCTLKVRRTTATFAKNGRLGLRQSSRTGEKVLKLKVATLSPTPHHPKVVAMLKVPFPLPDIEVERLCIRRRLRGFVPGQDNVNDTGPTCEGDYNGLELAAEDIKDIICSTALWLIVREGIAGVGRVSRKGDGWKLRS